MNLLYVCADRGIPLQGSKGASVHVRAITAALEGNGHRVVVAARNVDGHNRRPEVTATVSLEGEREPATAQLKELIETWHADLVIERYSLQSGAARDASAASSVPLLLEVNAPLVEEARRYRGLTDPEAEGREHEAFRRADLIQVVSPALLRYVRRVAPAVPSEWIPNGVSTDRFRSARRAETPGLQSGPVIGFVGSMKAWHGVDDLLAAFGSVRRDVSDAQLLLVGGGPEEHALRRHEVALAPENAVVFTGQVEQDQVPGYVRRFDVAVAPYRPQDDFYFYPLKVLEYLAAGVPVVYSDQGALAQIVGPAGLGYQPGSVDALADRIRSLLSDDGLRMRLAALAPAQAGGADWAAVADQVVRFSDTVVAAR